MSFSPEAEFVDVYVCAFKSASALLVSVEDVVVMDFGQKLFDGSPKDAIRDKNVIEAYLGVSTET